jgi:predicted nucleic acid-binding protein
MLKLAFLLDTNVVIGMLDGSAPAVGLLAQHGAVPDNSAVSQITRIELLSFHRLTGSDQQKIDALLASVAVLLFDQQIEAATIALRRRARLKLPDSIIAATAQVHGLTLLTLDDRLKAALAMV